MRRFLILAVMVAVTGCAAWTQNTTKAVEVTAVTAIALGDIFINVSGAYTSGCAAKVIVQTQCDAYRAFGLKFKENYPKALKAWEVARSLNDAASAAMAQQQVQVLAQDLNSFGTAALTVK